MARSTRRLADARIKARFADLGGMPASWVAGRFWQSSSATETEKWAKVIRAANIKVEMIPPAFSIRELEWSVQQRIWRDHSRPTRNRASHRTGTAVDPGIRGSGSPTRCADSGSNRCSRSFRSAASILATRVSRSRAARSRGLPLFDGGFTEPAGIAGRLGSLGSDAPIAFAELAPNAAEAGALGEARHLKPPSGDRRLSRGGGAAWILPEQCRPLCASLRSSGAAGRKRRSAVACRVPRDRARRFG